MMKSILTNALAGLIWCCLGLGCATGSGRVHYAEHVVAYDVDAHVVEKMEARLPLELVDIIHLSEKQVPDTLTIGYLKQERVIYQLNSDHVLMLTEKGVSRDVTDYLLSTPTTHAVPPVPRIHYLPPPFPYPYGYRGFYGAGYFCY